LFLTLCTVQGEFSEGSMHGNGKYTWTDGVIYEVISRVLCVCECCFCYFEQFVLCVYCFIYCSNCIY